MTLPQRWSGRGLLPERHTLPVAVALAVESAVTVAPDGEAMARLLMGLWAALAVTFAALAVTFAAVAVTFRRLHVPEPKCLVRAFLGLAVAATLVVVLMVVG
jgi:hypothetical protein